MTFFIVNECQQCHCKGHTIDTSPIAAPQHSCESMVSYYHSIYPQLINIPVFFRPKLLMFWGVSVEVLSFACMSSAIHSFALFPSSFTLFYFVKYSDIQPFGQLSCQKIDTLSCHFDPQSYKSYFLLLIKTMGGGNMSRTTTGTKLCFKTN